MRVQHDEELLNLINEVISEKKEEKAAKMATARTLWVPAVSNYGGYGRWAFPKTANPWDTQNLIRVFLATMPPHSICA